MSFASPLVAFSAIAMDARLRLSQCARPMIFNPYCKRKASLKNGRYSRTLIAKGGGSFHPRLDSSGLRDIQRAGLAIPVCPEVIRQALTGRRRGRLDVPGKCASLEVEIVTTSFGLDRAVALVVVE